MFPGIFQTARNLPKRRHLSCRRILLPLQAPETWLTLGYIFLRLLCSERIFCIFLRFGYILTTIAHPFTSYNLFHPVGACGEQAHRSFISPPSLWPGRVLRKYHCTFVDHRVAWVPPIHKCSWFCQAVRWIAAPQTKGCTELVRVQFSRCMA